MPQTQIHIAIIGAGASGTITAIQLLRKLNKLAQIFLIEKRGEAVCRGTAYSSKLEYEPLNVQADRMSAFNHLPDHFYQWVLANRSKDIARDSFVSRRWYGDYLTELFNQYKAEAAGVKVKTVVSTAQSISFDDASNRYNISFADGDNLQVDYIVFATGNETPQDIFSAEEIGLMGEQYVSRPWFNHPFEKLQKTDDVLIVGTGLTAVDHIVSLHQRNHAGKVYCFSRNGYLPLPHNEVMNYTFETSFEQKNVKQIFAELRTSLRNANAGKVNWQSVVDAFRLRVTRIWRGLSFEDKKYFLRHLKSYWEIHRHRMPQASNNIINGLIAEGKLEIINGRYKHIEKRGGQIVFAWTAPESDGVKSISVNRILNCTGPLGDYMLGNNDVIKGLITQGWMKQDVLKLGIETGIRGEIMMRNGIVLKNCYAVGPLRKANEWETTAIREIRTQAESLATYIADKVDALHDVLVDI